MKKTFLIVLIFLVMAMTILSGCAGMDTKDEMTQFAIETLGMRIGYDMRNSFEWTEDVQAYYDAVMVGQIDLFAAQAAQEYLKGRTHPLIADRMLRLAELTGFQTGMAGIIGIGTVDIELLKAAVNGFRMGLFLE